MINTELQHVSRAQSWGFSRWWKQSHHSALDSVALLEYQPSDARAYGFQKAKVKL